MDTVFISLVLWALIFLAGVLSVELGLSVAIIAISLGVMGRKFLRAPADSLDGLSRRV